MRPVVQDFVHRALMNEDIAGKTVLEVGSYNVNGSVRPYIESLEPAKYVGLDMREGPGVDLTWDCERQDELGLDWDLVVSTEMLEHAHDWRACMTQMATAVTPGGLLLVTTVSPGFPYHGYPSDFWRFPLEDLGCITETLGLDNFMLEDGREWMVAVLARKPLDWDKPGSLDDITVPGVT